MGWPAERIIDVVSNHYPKSILSVQLVLTAATVLDIETMVKTANGDVYPEGVTGIWMTPLADVRVTFDRVHLPTATSGLILAAGVLFKTDSNPLMVYNMFLRSTAGTTIEIELLG